MARGTKTFPRNDETFFIIGVAALPSEFARETWKHSEQLSIGILCLLLTMLDKNIKAIFFSNCQLKMIWCHCSSNVVNYLCNIATPNEVNGGRNNMTQVTFAAEGYFYEDEVYIGTKKTVPRKMNPTRQTKILWAS